MALFTFWSGIDRIPDVKTNDLLIGKASDPQTLASMMNLSEDKIQERLQQGHEAWVATFDSRPVSFGWVSRGRVRIGELAKEVDIPKGNAYLWNFRTLEYYRGLGYYPQLLISILLEEQKISDRIWIISAPENQSSSKGIQKAGFRPVGDLVFNYKNEVVLSVASVDERTMAGAAFIKVPITTSTTRPCWRCVSSAMNKEALCDCFEQNVPCRCDSRAKKTPNEIVKYL